MEERDKLLAEIAALEERETYYKQQVETASDAVTAEAFGKELAATQEKLAAARESIAQIDNAATTAQDELFNQFDNIAIGEYTFTLREMTVDEQRYQFLSAWLQQYVGNMAQQHAAIVASYQSEVTKLQEDVSELDTLRKANIDLTDKLADMETRRDAAAAELLEAQEEKKRLAADNESLRKQLETSNKPLQTNINTNLVELAKQINESKPAIYNKRWEDQNRKTHYLAELATTGETVRFGYLEAGKYREVSPEEAETFRVEAEQTVPDDTVQDSSLVTEPPAIPSETEDAGVQADSTTGTVVPDNNAVTRQEFEALKADVENIKRTLNIEVAA